MKARYPSVFRCQQTLAGHAGLWAEPTSDYHITYRVVHERLCSAEACCNHVMSRVWLVHPKSCLCWLQKAIESCGKRSRLQTLLSAALVREKLPLVSFLIFFVDYRYSRHS